MKDKLLLQFFLLFIPFLILWFLFSRIDFMNTLEIDKFSKENEQKLGKLMNELFIKSEHEVKGQEINDVVEEIKVKLCEAAEMNPEEVRVFIIESGMVNAFALPDQQLVLHTELIEFCDTPEELAGVMAHEIGHMKHRHVMKKLIKEIGVAMLFAVISGDAGGKILKDIAKKISSTSFDRDFETEADLFAAEIMQKSGIDPIHLANFLYKIGTELSSMPEAFEIVSTHPDSKKRSAEIIKARDTTSFTKVSLEIENWEELKKSVNFDYD